MNHPLLKSLVDCVEELFYFVSYVSGNSLKVNF